jgi:hypothetical protein
MNGDWGNFIMGLLRPVTFKPKKRFNTAKQLSLWLKNAAENTIIERGNHPTMAFLVKRPNHCLVVSAPLENPEQKDFLAETLRGAANDLQADYVAMVMESWVFQYTGVPLESIESAKKKMESLVDEAGSIENVKGRKEALTVVVAGKKDAAFLILYIERGEDNKITKLIHKEEPGAELQEGRFLLVWDEATSTWK